MTQWLEFWQQVLPSMVKLGQRLYEQHKGNVTSARAELRTITDQRGRRDAEEAALDERIEAERARQEAPPGAFSEASGGSYLSEADEEPDA